MKIWKNKSLSNLTLEVENIIYTERWLPIVGFDGLYDISNFGRIKSIQRVVFEKSGKKKSVKERIVSIQQFPNKYLVCRLWKENKESNFLVHRLVGAAFIENEQNKPEINHKYGDVEDNFYLNLEWATRSDNIQHSYDVLNRKPPCNMRGKFGKLHPNSKRIYCPTLGIYFESSRIAERELGISQGSISDICRGKQLHRDGLVFNFA